MTLQQVRTPLESASLDRFREGPAPGAGRLKLLMVTPRYFPYNGGVEHHVNQVARRLAKANFEVTILTTDPSGKLPANEQVDAVRIERVRAWPARRDYYLAPDIYRRIVMGDWDLVHVQSYHTLVAPLAMAAAIRAQIPFVLTFHGGGHSSRLRNSLRGLQLSALRPLLRQAERLVALTRFEIDTYSHKLGVPQEKFCLIPNGSDLPEAPPVIPPVDKRTVIASIGRLERYKGHQRILAALPWILEQKPDASLWIAGTGPYENELRRMAARLGVADRVDIRAIPAEERVRMAEELAQIDLVVLLSEFETHPIAILEALALGKPGLVANTSGLGELAEQGWVRSIPLHSTPKEIAAAALEQLESPILPEEVVLPTWDDSVNGLIDLYRSLLLEGQCVS